MCTVIFDMDGVIVDDNDYHYIAWRKFADNHGLKVPEKVMRDNFGMTNKNYLTFMFGRELDDEVLFSYEEEKEQIFRDIYKTDMVPVKGLIPLLKQLQAGGCKLGVATSAPDKNVDYILNGLKIREYFDKVVTASMISKGKPNPEIYYKAAEILNSEPAGCIVFEDSLHGIDAALGAGMKVIGLSTTHPAEKINKAHLVIKNFEEIQIRDMKKLIKNMEA
ncbi:MAG: HAD family hydrolase [Bacteroidota bacterium]